MWTGTPKEQRQLTHRGWVWPWTPGSSDHPVVGEMGLGGHHKDTGEHTASAPAPPSALFVIFRLLSFSFRETVAQGPSGLVPVFTTQAAEPGCLFLAGNCCCWALPPPFRDPPQSAAVAQGRLGGTEERCRPQPLPADSERVAGLLP